jgi:hypothetical protein
MYHLATLCGTPTKSHTSGILPLDFAVTTLLNKKKEFSGVKESCLFPIDILVNLDGEQNKMFGENLCVSCMAIVPMYVKCIIVKH